MAVRRVQGWVGALAALFGLAMPPQSWAQVGGKGVSEQGARAVEVEEVTVVAQKREENIQEVPISVTALTAQKIDEQGITDVISLGDYAPNLQVTAHGAGTVNASITIRGLSQPVSSIAMQTAAGQYVDGFYIAKLYGSNLDLQDLDHVEVLRGPQGTLYGRNTIAGALSLITKKPTEKRSVTLRTEVGNYDAFKSHLTLNVPLVGKNGFWQSDTLGTISLRQNLDYQAHDGRFRVLPAPPSAPYTGPSRIDDMQRYSTMTQLRWQPREEMTVDYSFQYQNIRSTGPAYQTVAVFPGRPASTPGSPFDLTPYVRPSREDSVWSRSSCAEGAGSCRRQHMDSDNRLHILTAAYDLGEVGALGNVTLKSISGYRSFRVDVGVAFDGSPLHVADTNLHEIVEHWSEEVQVVGTAPRISYVLGGYYYGESGKERASFAFFNGATAQVVSGKTETESLAPYGQATWTPPILNDRLDVTAGLRFTYEHVDASTGLRCIAAGGRPCANLDWKKSLSATFSDGGRGFPAFTPNLNLAYQLTDDAMTYFRIARGFKSGGIAILTPNPLVARPFDSERLLQYELGFKSDWFDKRLRLNAAGYYSDYADLQQTISRISPGGATTNFTSNVESAEVWGSEIEMTAVPLRGLEATATYGLTLPSYKKWMDLLFDANGRPVIENGTPVLTDVSDKRVFVGAPEHSARLSLAYTAPPTTAGVFSANVDFNWEDRQFFANDSSTLGGWAMRAGSYYVVNGRVQFAEIPLRYGSLDVVAFGRNLFNMSYRTWGLDYTTFGFTVNSFGPPRTFGLQLIYNFSET